MSTPNSESLRDSAINTAVGGEPPLPTQSRNLLEEYLGSILVCGVVAGEHVRYLTADPSNRVLLHVTISREEIDRLLIGGLCEVTDSTLIALALCPELLEKMTSLIARLSPAKWVDRLIEADRRLGEKNGWIVPTYSEVMGRDPSSTVLDGGITNDQPGLRTAPLPSVNGKLTVGPSSSDFLSFERPSNRQGRRQRVIGFLVASSVLVFIGSAFLFYQGKSAIAEQKRREETHLCIPKDRLYTLSGLKTARPGPLFQDFASMSTAGGRLQINTVSRLWADGYTKSWITATVVNSQGAGRHSNFLRIRFRNGRGGYSSNVTVRPKWEEAVIASDFMRLIFEARVPHEGKEEEKSGKLPEVAPENTDGKPLDVVYLTVRVVDARDTHWEYAVRHPDRHIHNEVTKAQSEGEGWKKVVIDLRDNSKWQLFTPEGNSTYAANAPDFSIISHVVIEVGGKGESRPGPGWGTVDIAHIRLE